MTEYMQLLGVEQVENAARTISGAAVTMNSAANILSEVLSTHQRFMEEWLNRFENLLRELPTE